MITTNRKKKRKLQISEDDSTTSNVFLADVSNDSSDVTFYANKLYKVSKKEEEKLNDTWLNKDIAFDKKQQEI